MTDAALMSEMAGRASGPAPAPNPVPVKPPWLRPVAFAAVILAHAGLAAMLMKVVVQHAESIDSISLDLVQQGDLVETEESAATDDTPPPPEEAEEPEALLPPMVMAPDAPPLPEKKKEVVAPKKKIVEKPPETVVRSDQRREAQARRRAGAPEGRSQSSGMSKATCTAMVGAAIRRHVPGTTSLGPGSATVTFRTSPGGGVIVVSASGSPGHAALARRIVSSARAPAGCASVFASVPFRFH